MITIYSEDHLLRNVRTELHGGLLVPPHECPERVAYVLQRISEVALGQVVAPTRSGLAPVLRVHDAAFIEFLRTAWTEWEAAGNRGEAIPDCWPARRMAQRCPSSITGKLGYYAMAGETSIGPGTWEAAQTAADVALTAATELSRGARAAFALCRPPGHHAAHDLYGGYCFINNAAVAAQSLLDQGARRVAILDVDFHHGNGTQDIFYHRDDVLYVSLHGDPQDAFPYFSGYADERGIGKGEGYTLNFPMARGTPFSQWGQTLAQGLARIKDYAPDVLIVSLGVDTYEGDPISFFKLTSPDFTAYGEMLGRLRLPTLFVFEGGYAVKDVGVNTVNVLTGFEQA